MADTLQNIIKQIQKNQADIGGLRKQSQNEAQKSAQYSQQGNSGQAEYHQREADALVDKANDLEHQNRGLESQQTQLEQEINDLEQKKEQMTNDMNQKIQQMTDDINRKRGTSFSF